MRSQYIFFRLNSIVTPVTKDPVNVPCTLNNISVSFQLDSGASISTSSYCDAKKVSAQIYPSSIQLQAYNGGLISLVGETKVNVTYNNITFMHTFFVVSHNSVNLLGRDLFEKLNIKVVLPDAVHDIRSKFHDYLSDDFSSNVKETVHLDVSKNATPIFAKARQVAIKLRDKVTTELQRLVQEGK